MWWRRKPAGRDQRIARAERETSRLFAELDSTQRQFRVLARRVWRVQEEERRNLARNLHDDLGQLLTALVHRVERMTGDGREQCLELARQARDRVRELSRLLRPPVLDDLGLAASLAWLARQARDNSGIAVTVNAPPELARAEPEVEILVFRIVQEALTNAIEHATASAVVIDLTRTGNQLELRIRDDGRGFDPAAVRGAGGTGIGLAGMRDRVSLFGGTLAVSSAAGRGTVITATLTLADGLAPEETER